ncbi:hypothetical protein ABZW49_11055 [Nonomuraea wenchangensis]
MGRARDLRLAGVTLSRTVRGHVEELRKALERGATVKVLLIDPSGGVPEEAARRSTIDGRGEVFEHRVTSTLHLLEGTVTRRRDHFWFEHFTAEFDRMWEVSRKREPDQDG